MTDFGVIAKELHATDDRLKNWAAWANQRPGRKVSSLWKMARSNWRQWHAPELRPDIDQMDAQYIEKLITRDIPHVFRDVLVWWYIKQDSINKMAKKTQMSQASLYILLQDARKAIKNKAKAA